jgi:hypothetical protein
MAFWQIYSRDSQRLARAARYPMSTRFREQKFGIAEFASHILRKRCNSVALIGEITASINASRTHW